MKSAATGGASVTGINPGTIVNTIITLVAAAVSSITKVTLVPSAAIAPFVVSISASSEVRPPTKPRTPTLPSGAFSPFHIGEIEPLVDVDPSDAETLALVGSIRQQNVTIDLKGNWELQITDAISSTFVLGTQGFATTQKSETGTDRNFAGPGLGVIGAGNQDAAPFADCKRQAQQARLAAVPQQLAVNDGKRISRRGHCSGL